MPHVIFEANLAGRRVLVDKLPWPCSNPVMTRDDAIIRSALKSGIEAFKTCGYTIQEYIAELDKVLAEKRATKVKSDLSTWSLPELVRAKQISDEMLAAQKETVTTEETAVSSKVTVEPRGMGLSPDAAAEDGKPGDDRSSGAGKASFPVGYAADNRPSDGGQAALSPVNRGKNGARNSKRAGSQRPEQPIKSAD